MIYIPSLPLTYQGRDIRDLTRGDPEGFRWLNRRFTLSVNGSEEKNHLFMTAIDSISRFVLRTGAPRLTPTREDDPCEDVTCILPLADEKDEEAVYDLISFSVESSE